MSYKKMLKKMRKYIQKEFDINYIDLKLDDKLINVAERIVIKSENCNLEEAYKKWILSPNLHLPGWISFYIADEFTNREKVNKEDTLKEIFDKMEK